MVQGVEVKDGCLIDTNPATGEVIAKVKMSTPEEVDAAVKNAKDAQPDWADVPLAKRIDYIKAALKDLASRKEKVAEMMTKEMGKIPSEAIEEATDACNKDKFLKLVHDANKPEIITNDNGSESIIVRDPLGVVAVISPWNFPCDEILLLALPALAAGNCVIVKPSEVVPLTGELVVSSLIKCLPKNVIQLLQGDGSVGQKLVESDINMVAMTGSSATGKKIMQSASANLKRLVLELGGKDPMVVFKDCDLEKAANDAVFFSVFNCGQVCCSVERIYVEDKIYDEFGKRCADICKEMCKKENAIAPMVSKVQREIVDGHVKDAVSKGAKVLFKQSLSEAATSKGNYFPVTVLADLTGKMKISTEETFGPVVCLQKFSGSEKEAVDLANDSEYGLSASVYTQDLEKAVRVSKNVKAGQVGINNWPLANAPKECPWIGHKGSGFGFHSGLDGWRQFSLPKSLIATVPIKKASKFMGDVAA